MLECMENKEMFKKNYNIIIIEILIGSVYLLSIKNLKILYKWMEILFYFKNF